jgi:hypothetical protein
VAKARRFFISVYMTLRQRLFDGLIATELRQTDSSPGFEFDDGVPKLRKKDL